MEEQEDKLYCPYCGSSQLTANKKGFGAGKAVAGAVLTGGVGLLAGFIGSGDVKITCLNCGCQWKPGQLKTTPLSEYDKRGYYEREQIKEEEKRKAEEPMGIGTKIILWLFAIMFFIICLAMCK
ncbi:hypothetical protein [Bacteroides oleiciplenus]|uniref:LITAF domain-containing protein n=1 Tax=Bacteroides oleiciplenus TaxID=626931 RepID=A0A3E5BIH6_9BACE|nr:hypothetical protein [Bacteroides oleiciplenus]RGN37402.1 hypothetical protein DXB65_07845 [Bacteroides oleiciplenus]